MLMSSEQPGKWTVVREKATYSYNMLRHSTTGNTPFKLMHGLPIRHLMNEERLESALYGIDNTDKYMNNR